MPHDTIVKMDGDDYEIETMGDATSMADTDQADGGGAYGQLQETLLTRHSLLTASSSAACAIKYT